MRINVLQHTPNEGPGAIKSWANKNNHEIYVYHPETFNHLPTVDDTDLLVILGCPMSPNDDVDWIIQERKLIKQMLKLCKPIFGACFGAQQIAKALGYIVLDAPHKEVGWAPVYLQDKTIPDIPKKLTALHWHQQMFEIPKEAKLLFSSDLGLYKGKKLQGHLGEPEYKCQRRLSAAGQVSRSRFNGKAGGTACQA